MEEIFICGRELKIVSNLVIEKNGGNETIVHHSNKIIPFFFDGKILIFLCNHILFYLSESISFSTRIEVEIGEDIITIHFSEKEKRLLLIGSTSFFVNQEILRKLRVFSLSDENEFTLISTSQNYRSDSNFYFSDDRIVVVTHFNGERFVEVISMRKGNTLYFFTFQNPISSIIFCANFLLLKSDWKVYNERGEIILDSVFYLSQRSFAYSGKEVVIYCNLPKHHFHSGKEVVVSLHFNSFSLSELKEKYFLSLFDVECNEKIDFYFELDNSFPKIQFSIKFYYVSISSKILDIVFILRGTSRIFCFIPSTEEFFEVKYTSSEVRISDFLPSTKQLLLPIFNENSVIPVIYYNL